VTWEWEFQSPQQQQQQQQQRLFCMTPRRALGFARPHIHCVTGDYLGVQIGWDVETFSKNTKILPQIMS